MVSKLSNQLILAWILIGISIILAIIELAGDGFKSFQKIGDFLNSILMGVLGISVLISTNKKIRKIRGQELSIGDFFLTYKSNSEDLSISQSNIPISLKKTIKHIEIKTNDDKIVTIDLDDFKLDFKELKQIEGEITRLNKEFEKYITINNA
jgi:hypothetical protein